MKNNWFGRLKRTRYRSLRKKFWRLTDALPVVLPVFATGMSVVSMLFLVTNQFRIEYIFPVGVVVSAALSLLVYKKYPRSNIGKETKVALVLLLVLVGVWTAFNSWLSSEHIQTNRDPALYSVEGLRLADETDLIIPTSSVLSDISELTQSSAGFDYSDSYPGTLYAQGAHLLPALLGAAGKVGGDWAVLHFNPIFGGLAIIALFGFVRLVVRDRWALLAALAFSATLPLIYFSRDTYTEPLSAMFVFSALTLLVSAAKTRSVWLWLVAGIVAGSSTLARVDATLFMIGIVVGGFAYLIFSEKKERLKSLWHVAIFLLSMVSVAILAFVDVYLLSRGYFDDLSHKIWPLYGAFIGVVMAGLFLVLITWKTAILEKLNEKTKRWRGRAAVIVVVATGAVLATRPLWMVGHRETPLGLTAGLQGLEGLSVDPYRDYAEQTLNWMLWYIGPVLLVFSLVGIAIIAYKAVTTKSVLWLASIAVIVAVALLYFNKPSITPDQIWAARRFLPVVIPGLIAFGVVGLAWLYDRKKKILGISIKQVVIVLSALAVTFPATVSYPFLFVGTYENQYSQVNDVCANIKNPEKTTIVWGGAGMTMIEPVRALCNVDSYRIKNEFVQLLGDKEFLSEIAMKARESGHTVLLGLYSDQRVLAGVENLANFKLVSTINFYDYEKTLSRPPVYPEKFQRSVFMSEIGVNGALVPLN